MVESSIEIRNSRGYSKSCWLIWFTFLVVDKGCFLLQKHGKHPTQLSVLSIEPIQYSTDRCIIICSGGSCKEVGLNNKIGHIDTF